MAECESVRNSIKELGIISIFGFDGKISTGLKVHPDQEHILYPLGNKVSILNFNTNEQIFLSGHTHSISAIDVSPSGKKIASGQTNHMGFRAYVIIWDWDTKTENARHELHKVRIESLSFTSYDKYLVSLGGPDDGQVLVWDVDKREAVCMSCATRETTGDASRLSKLQNRSGMFVTAGEENLRFWCLNEKNRKLVVHDVTVGKLRREYTAIRVSPKDDVMYVGTMSGDIVKILLNCHPNPEQICREKPPVLLGCFAKHNPKKPPGKDCVKYSNGVRDLCILPSGKLIVGAGDGTVELVEERTACHKDYPQPAWPQFKTLNSKKVNGAVTSLQLFRNDLILVGTDACEIYSIQLKTFEMKLLKTCHTSAVYDIAFPHNFSMVFATASYQSIRIWSTKQMQELLRIMVPNFTASAVVFSPDGKSVISAWNDGYIRGFTPLTGRLIFAIPNAHNKGVASLAISSNGRVLVSGGVEGQVRLWKIEPHKQSLIGVLKEHVGPVGTVHLNCFDNEIVSSSNDGSCIIWDVVRLCRKHVLFANTQFTCARYFPTGVQILGAGSDRRIRYWEVYDGSLVREVEGSTKGSINCVDINGTGEHFVSVGNDQIVKLWNYQEGLPVSAGYGHASVITVGKYSPCGKFLVSGSADGAVIIWKIPTEYHMKPKLKPVSSAKSVVSRAGSNRSVKSGRSVGSAKTKKSVKCQENITELETSRKDKEMLCCECPATVNESPKSKKSTTSTRYSK